MQGPDGEMGSEGETHLPFPDAVLHRVCGHARRTHARSHTHVYSEWCPLLLGVLALLMRCERGTEMEQVQDRRNEPQRKSQSRCSLIKVEIEVNVVEEKSVWSKSMEGGWSK